MAARLLFIGMWNFADDLGRIAMSPKSLKAQVFPSDDINSDSILGMVHELSANGLLLPYEVGGKSYLQITGWQHQRIDKPQPGKHPSPVNGYSTNVPGMVATDTIGKEEKGKEKSKSADATASDADAPRDFRSELFGRGLRMMAAMTGKGPDACRSFVGKCLKASGDDAIVVLGLIEDAERNRVVDPSAWISARLKSTGPPARPATAFQQRRNETMEICDELDNFASGSSGSSPSHSGLLRYDPSQ